MILTTSFNDVVKNARVQWRTGFDEVKAVARSLYDVRSVSEMTSEHSSFSGYGFAKRKAEGSSYTYGNIKQGYKLNLSQTRIGLMDAITWEMKFSASPILVTIYKKSVKLRETLKEAIRSQALRGRFNDYNTAPSFC